MAERNVRKKRKLGSYPFLSVIFSITLAVFVIGVYGLLFVYSNSLIGFVKDNIEVHVYLNKQSSQSDVDFLIRSLSESDFASKEGERSKVRFLGREEIAEQYIDEGGEDFRDLLEDNPFRDAIVVGIAPSHQHPDSMLVIKKRIEGQRGVYEAAYEKQNIESISENLYTIGLVLGSIALVLLLAVVILINNTIRLAMFSQRFLIRSMQLVGATGGFIRRPFLVRAILYGLIAGGVSVGLLYGMMSYGNAQIPDLELIEDMNNLYVLFGVLIILGALVGYFSTLWAVRKYLKMSLDELY